MGHSQMAVVINTRVSHPRDGFNREEPPVCGIAPGTISQVNTLDQHCKAFRGVIQEHQAPASSCGAFSCAHAIIIGRCLAQGETDTESILAKVMDVEMVTAELRKTMAFIQQSRAA